MTEQPTTPPEPPARPMPRLGRGGRWSAHLDEPLPQTEPYQPKPRPRPPGGWPKTGTVGATTHLTGDEQPVTVPARPYGAPPTPSLGETGSSLGDQSADLRDVLHAEIRSVLGDRPACDHGTATGTYCWLCAQRDRGAELRAYAAPVEASPAAGLRALADVGETTWHTTRDGGLRAVRSGEKLQSGDISRHGTLQADGTITPWPEDLACAACGKPRYPLHEADAPGPTVRHPYRNAPKPPSVLQLRAMADDLNAHGGLDETFVAGLLQAAAGGSETGGNSGRGPWRRLRNALTQRLR